MVFVVSCLLVGWLVDLLVYSFSFVCLFVFFFNGWLFSCFFVSSPSYPADGRFLFRIDEATGNRKFEMSAYPHLAFLDLATLHLVVRSDFARRIRSDFFVRHIQFDRSIDSRLCSSYPIRSFVISNSIVPSTLNNNATKGGFRRLEKSHKVWMMMIAASLMWARAAEKPEQSKMTFKIHQNDSKQFAKLLNQI